MNYNLIHHVPKFNSSEPHSVILQKMQSEVECYSELKADVLIVFVSFRKIVFLFYVSFSVRLPKKSALFVFLANSSWKALASSLVRFRSSSPHPKKILSQYFRLNFDYSIDQTDWLRKIDKKKQGDNSKKRETRLFHHPHKILNLIQFKKVWEVAQSATSYNGAIKVAEGKEKLRHGRCLDHSRAVCINHKKFGMNSKDFHSLQNFMRSKF